MQQKALIGLYENVHFLREVDFCDDFRDQIAPIRPSVLFLGTSLNYNCVALLALLVCSSPTKALTSYMCVCFVVRGTLLIPWPAGS